MDVYSPEDIELVKSTLRQHQGDFSERVFSRLIQLADDEDCGLLGVVLVAHARDNVVKAVNRYVIQKAHVF
jgi:hypothetical protein